LSLNLPGWRQFDGTVKTPIYNADGSDGPDRDGLDLCVSKSEPAVFEACFEMIEPHGSKQ